MPIKIKKDGGGYRVSFGEDGIEAYIYVRDKRLARKGVDWNKAEALAKKLARTLSEAWTRSC